MRQKVVQASDGDLAAELGRVKEGELGFHIVGQRASDERFVGPRLAAHAAGPDLGRGGSGQDRRADHDTVVCVLGDPHGRHGVAVTTTVGDDVDLHARG